LLNISPPRGRNIYFEVSKAEIIREQNRRRKEGGTIMRTDDFNAS
jgi:hypothetical protein